MKSIGKVFATIVALALPLVPMSSQAAVMASVDRDRIAMGDTLRLTISATDGEDTRNTDLRPLLADFEVLQRSTSSSTSIVNGRRTQTRQILIDMTPRRQGTLKVPPLRVGQAESNMLLVAVGPPPDTLAADQTLLFEAQVDRESVYVQGQLILTLRIQQSVNLENRSITELQLDNAFVKPLEQKSFQRNIDGRPWLVHELRYAIFPEQSGTLEIPAQTFSARESSPRRSFFDLGNDGRQVRRTSNALSIAVMPRPVDYPDNTWLPARSLTLEESWSTPPEQLRAGESATRTIVIKGDGLQGAQLPPILLPQTDGLKYYPDQPVISEQETGIGLRGSRQDSAALVPTRAGSWTIPEIRIPWWDTEKRELRYAVLPQRVLNVAASDPAFTATAAPLGAPAAATAPIAVTPAQATSDKLFPWQALTAFTAAGWLLTLVYLLGSRRNKRPPPMPHAENASEKHAFKQLLAACASDSPAQSRQAVIAWAASVFPDQAIRSTDQVAAAFADDGLAAQLTQMDAALYSTGTTTWHGAVLADIAKALRKQVNHPSNTANSELSLYPT